MRLHYFQHVPFEDLGMIADWAGARGHAVTCTPFFEPNPAPPDPREYDALVVMGGPMGVHDTEAHPWLDREKTAIRAALEAGRPVLGICLGAQLIADCLGARVAPNKVKEIGWFPVDLTPAASRLEIFAGFKRLDKVLHWHGDMFEIPKGAERLAASAACANQGFILGDRVIGLQFHIEITASGLERLIAACADSLIEAPFVQSPDEMREEARHADTRDALYVMLDHWSMAAAVPEQA